MTDKKMNFKFTECEIAGVYIIEPVRFDDSRGFFMETYHKEKFAEAGLDYDFVQENESRSSYGVLRGLHFQKNHPQAKLVRCTEGEVFDVCVDLRPDSCTFGKWYGVILSAENHKQFLIPRGFAHGFLVLSQSATFCYKCDDIYYPDDSCGIIYNDASINVNWPKTTQLILSDKDMHLPTLEELLNENFNNRG